MEDRQAQRKIAELESQVANLTATNKQHLDRIVSDSVARAAKKEGAFNTKHVVQMLGKNASLNSQSVSNNPTFINV